MNSPKKKAFVRWDEQEIKAFLRRQNIDPDFFVSHVGSKREGFAARAFNSDVGTALVCYVKNYKDSGEDTWLLLMFKRSDFSHTEAHDACEFFVNHLGYKVSITVAN